MGKVDQLGWWNLRTHPICSCHISVTSRVGLTSVIRHQDCTMRFRLTNRIGLITGSARDHNLINQVHQVNRPGVNKQLNRIHRAQWATLKPVSLIRFRNSQTNPHSPVGLSQSSRCIDCHGDIELRQPETVRRFVLGSTPSQDCWIRVGSSPTGLRRCSNRSWKSLVHRQRQLRFAVSLSTGCLLLAEKCNTQQDVATSRNDTVRLSSVEISQSVNQVKYNVAP